MEPEVDPYSYLRREEFTSEKFKLEIRCLPRVFGFKDVQCLVSTCGVVAHKVKKVNDLFYVTFSSEEDRMIALDQLHNRNVKGRNIKVKKSKPMADPYLSHQKALQDSTPDGPPDCKRPKMSKEEMQQQLYASVTPMVHLEYEQQLVLKAEALKKSLVTFERELLKETPAAKEWIEKNKKQFGSGVCCNFLPVIPSPSLRGYRNKCEFSVGTDLEGNEKTVGFRLSSYKSGVLSVVEPDCAIVSSLMQRIVASFQTLIRASSYDQYNVVNHQGHWRGLTIRTGNNSANVMIIVHFSPQSLSPEQLAEEKSRICQSLQAQYPEISSLYWNNVKTINSCSSSAIDDLELVAGDSKIEEKVLSSKFRLSPTAFFQVNTKATELLYSLVCDWAGTCRDSTVMDVCCGTGTIGIMLARTVRRVIGIELCPQAINDAKENAHMNNLSNITYHCGKAEECLPMLAETLMNVKDVSAVVDPPRNGLHKIVIQSLRKCSFLTKLVYVSCNANNAVSNWVDLCRPKSKRFAGQPFTMVAAQPVDLFPHTNHCELVVLFERNVHDPTSENPVQNLDTVKDEQISTSAVDKTNAETAPLDIDTVAESTESSLTSSCSSK